MTAIRRVTECRWMTSKYNHVKSVCWNARRITFIDYVLRFAAEHLQHGKLRVLALSCDNGPVRYTETVRSLWGFVIDRLVMRGRRRRIAAAATSAAPLQLMPSPPFVASVVQQCRPQLRSFDDRRCFAELPSFWTGPKCERPRDVRFRFIFASVLWSDTMQSRLLQPPRAASAESATRVRVCHDGTVTPEGSWIRRANYDRRGWLDVPAAWCRDHRSAADDCRQNSASGASRVHALVATPMREDAFDVVKSGGKWPSCDGKWQS